MSHNRQQIEAHLSDLDSADRKKMGFASKAKFSWG
jgi:hypothetical protein